jgi:hypothetical protein
MAMSKVVPDRSLPTMKKGELELDMTIEHAAARAGRRSDATWPWRTVRTIPERRTNCLLN